MSLNCASFNVLADAYLGYGDYRHVAPELLENGARIPHLIRVLTELEADVIGLQEAEAPLVVALEATGKWQLFWSQKQGGQPDGCLILVRPGLVAKDFTTYVHSDGSHRIVQSLVIENTVFVNAHIQWAAAHEPHHFGVVQTAELLEWFDEEQRPVAIFADCNDRPGGRVRALIEAAGFVNAGGDKPTALIGTERAALDLIAVRDTHARHIETGFRLEGIPNLECPSDHIPVMACIETA